MSHITLPRSIAVLIALALSSHLLCAQQEAARKDETPLEEGSTIARPLAGPDVHSFRLTLPAGHLLRIIAEQRGINIALTLFGPDGQKIAEGHSVYTTNLYEPLMLEALTAGAGDHRLEIRSLKKNVAAGSYELRVEKLKEPDALERRRVRAQDVFAQGNVIRARDSYTWPEVIDRYQAALALFRDAGDRRSEATALAEIGRTYMLAGENKKALAYSEEALPILREVEDRRGEARALLTIGWVQNLSGERQRSLQTLRQASVLYQGAGDRRGEAMALQTVGRVYSSMLECEEAIEYNQRSMAIFREIGDRRGEARAYALTGLYHEYMSELTEALDQYMRALDIHQSIGERGGEADLLDDIARIYDDLGEKRKAIDHLAQVLELAQSRGETGASVLTAIGDLLNELGERQSALQSYRKALGLMRAARLNGSPDWHHDEAKVLVAIGRVHLALSEKQKAQ